MNQVPVVQLRPHKTAAFLSRHPWVLGKSIVEPSHAPTDGAEVDLVAPDGRWVARGIYNSRSHIRVRLYSWTPGQALDEAFWRSRLQTALALRESTGFAGIGQSARLVFSEADGLSGLVVDRYGSHLVVQVTALAMATRLDLIERLLVEILAPAGLVVRTDRKIATAEGLAPIDRAWGEPLPDVAVIEENGLRFQVDLGAGQKTGYYLDQRENRAAAARYMAGRKVLDLFCYVGGFSLAALRLGHASEVLGVDGSQRAIEHARANAAANDCPTATFEVADCFDRLAELAASPARFGAVVLDPPRLAGSKQSIDQALRAYHRLNRLAVEALEPGGILVTCSCSGRVDREEFRRMLFGVGQKTRRDIQVLEARGPSPDHPVRLACPETDYLKCFICRVV